MTPAPSYAAAVSALPPAANAYEAAVSQPDFDPAACHREAIRAVLRRRQLYWQARRDGNLVEAAKQLDFITWYRDRARIWKAMVRADAAPLMWEDAVV